MKILFWSFFTASSGKFNIFDASNLILFQIIGFGKCINETTLARYFTIFICDRAIKLINRVHKYYNEKYAAKILLYLLLIWIPLFRFIIFSWFLEVHLGNALFTMSFILFLLFASFLLDSQWVIAHIFYFRTKCL